MSNTGSDIPRGFSLAGLIVIAAGAAGFVLYRKICRNSRPDAGRGRTRDRGIGSAPGQPAAGPKAKTVPDTLPDITLANLDGKPTKLAESSAAGRSW